LRSPTNSKIALTPSGMGEGIFRPKRTKWLCLTLCIHKDWNQPSRQPRPQGVHGSVQTTHRGARVRDTPRKGEYQNKSKVSPRSLIKTQIRKRKISTLLPVKSENSTEETPFVNEHIAMRVERDAMRRRNNPRAPLGGWGVGRTRLLLCVVRTERRDNLARLVENRHSPLGLGDDNIIIVDGDVFGRSQIGSEHSQKLAV